MLWCVGGRKEALYEYEDKKLEGVWLVIHK